MKLNLYPPGVLRIFMKYLYIVTIIALIISFIKSKEKTIKGIKKGIKRNGIKYI